MKIFKLEIKNFIIVINDVHLCLKEDISTYVFLKFLQSLPRKAHVFFAGDIFEFAFAGSLFFYQYWKKIWDWVIEYRADGGFVYFLEGNHDFGFMHFSQSSISQVFTGCYDGCVVFSHPVYSSIAIMHGDYVISSRNYKIFRSIVKNYCFQKIASLIPGKFMHEIFIKFAKTSRKLDTYRPLSQAFFQTQMENFLADKDWDVCILGHVHQSIDIRIKNTRVIANPAWIQTPHALFIYENGTIERLIYHSDKGWLLNL